MAAVEREPIRIPDYPYGTLVFRRDMGRGEFGVVTYRSGKEYFYLPEEVKNRSVLTTTNLSIEKGLCPSLPLLGRPRGWRISNLFHTGEEEVTIEADFIEVGRREQPTVFNNVWYWFGRAIMLEPRRDGAVGGLAEAVEVAFIPVLPIQGKRKSGEVLVISIKDFLNKRYKNKIKEFLSRGS